jgi:DNA polymerase III epsilon subunit-like protein
MTTIAFITTETNGLHKKIYKLEKNKSLEQCMEIIPNVDNKFKNLYMYAHLLSLKYNIGIFKDGKFTKTKSKKFIFKPNNFILDSNSIQFHGYTMEKLLKKGKNPYKILQEFTNDIKNINYLVFHSANYHIKAIQAELLRNCVYLNFNNYKIIDLNTFNHNITNPSLNNLAETFLKKVSKNKLKMIKKIFFKLYNNYINQI